MQMKGLRKEHVELRKESVKRNGIPSTFVVSANVHGGLDSLACLIDWACARKGGWPLAHGVVDAVLNKQDNK